MSKLKVFTCSQNYIKVMPPTFGDLRLEALDVSGNPFDTNNGKTVEHLKDVLSLMEQCARVVRNKKLVCAAVTNS